MRIFLKNPTAIYLRMPIIILLVNSLLFLFILKETFVFILVFFLTLNTYSIIEHFYSFIDIYVLTMAFFLTKQVIS